MLFACLLCFFITVFRNHSLFSRNTEPNVEAHFPPCLFTTCDGAHTKSVIVNMTSLYATFHLEIVFMDVPGRKNAHGECFYDHVFLLLSFMLPVHMTEMVCSAVSDIIEKQQSY